MQLILASASPRRKALLSLFGIPFTVRAADIDETMDPEKPPFDEVARVSRSEGAGRQPGRRRHRHCGGHHRGLSGEGAGQAPQ